MWLLRFWTCLLLLTLWQGSMKVATACSCLRQHPQTAFCKSDFTAVVRIKGSSTADRDWTEYKVKYQKVFKSSPKFEEVMEKGSLYTPSSGSMCGVTLNVGVNYLISGSVNNGWAMVRICNIVKPWSKVVGRQRKAYRQLYHHGCDCKISYTSWLYKGYAYDKTGGKECLWESKPGPEDCQQTYGVCMRGVNGCSWKPTIGYKNCIKEHQWNREHQRHKET